MAKLNKDWCRAFNECFEDEEDVVEFIFERLDTKDFEDSFINMGGYGEPNESFRQTAEDKKQILYDFMMWLVNERKE